LRVLNSKKRLKSLSTKKKPHIKITCSKCANILRIAQLRRARR